MSNKILVLGSGKSEPIETSTFKKIYSANISFKRAITKKDIVYIFSKALLSTRNDLKNAPSINGLTREASNKIRIEKYNKINAIQANKIYVVSNSKKKTTTSLKRKKIGYSALEIINHKKLWKLYYRTYKLEGMFKIFQSLPTYKLKSAFIIQCVFRKRMSTFYKPSTGITSIMLAFLNEPESLIYSSGICVYDQNKNRNADWDGVNVQYDDSSHVMDGLYIELLKSKGLNII